MEGGKKSSVTGTIVVFKLRYANWTIRSLGQGLGFSVPPSQCISVLKTTVRPEYWKIAGMGMEQSNKTDLIYFSALIYDPKHDMEQIT